MPGTIAAALVDRALLLSRPSPSPALVREDTSPSIALLLADPLLIGLTKLEVLLGVVAVGRAVLPRWLERFPGLEGPAAAIAAAEAWAAAPSTVTAEASLRAAEPAIQQALAQWHGRDKAAVWSGRTAAWVAMAPLLDWPAVAAIAGACLAVGRENVSAALAESVTFPYMDRQ